VFSSFPLPSFARKRPVKELRLHDARGREVLIRFALGVLVLFATLLGRSVEAQAAPIGMCADTAQSIEAPPPMFPADDAELKSADNWGTLGCQAGDEERFVPQKPGAPSDRVAPSSEIPDQKVILGETVPVLRSGSVRIALSASTLCLPEEHRWRGLRPPRN
jgi:hypothetical protein